MLRIMNPGAMPPPPPSPPPDPTGPSPDPTGQPPQGPADQAPLKYSIHKASPDTAGYLGPENGPFLCGNCIHFDEGGSCQLVDGPIDPQGCCNLFTSNGSQDPDQGMTDDSQGMPDVPQAPLPA